MFEMTKTIKLLQDEIAALKAEAEASRSLIGGLRQENLRLREALEAVNQDVEAVLGGQTWQKVKTALGEIE